MNALMNNLPTALPQVPGREGGNPVPLVSCIMPTKDRAPFAAQAVEYFRCQDYPNRELVIVYDEQRDLPANLDGDKRIRLLQVTAGSSIGYKRNQACRIAKGEIIIHWDDDDWMAPGWIRCQSEHLLREKADITGLTKPYFCSPQQEKAWQYIYPDNQKTWVLGGSLCYTRAFWERNPFQELNIGEDSGFVWSQNPKKIAPHHHIELYVALVHDKNTSPKFTYDSRWKPVPFNKIRTLMFGNLINSTSEAEFSLPSSAQTCPLVSCIMPTYNRPHFLRQAILCFLRQTYESSELIVVDDSETPVQELCSGLFRVRYLRLDRRTSLGEKLNIGIRHAQGTIIQKWDDDDYYHPVFLEKAVNTLTGAPPGRNLAAWRNFPVLLLPGMSLHLSGEGWAAGGTFCFYRDLWEEGPFRDVPSGVDSFFIQDLRPTILGVNAPGLYMLVRHGYNTWNHMGDGKTGVDRFFGLQPTYPHTLEELVEPIDCYFYRTLSKEGGFS